MSRLCRKVLRWRHLMRGEISSLWPWAVVLSAPKIVTFRSRSGFITEPASESESDRLVGAAGRPPQPPLHH